MQSDLLSMPCKSCSAAGGQSKEYQCTALGLKKALFGSETADETRTSIQAAYCNDEYLVLWGLGLPPHKYNLESIPRPPGVPVTGAGSGY